MNNFTCVLKRDLSLKLMLLYIAQCYLFLKTPFSNTHVASLLSSAAEANVSIQLRILYLVLTYETF
jgi:hypothetical protein